MKSRKIISNIEATKYDILEIKMEIVDIKSGSESLKSRVEDLELAKTSKGSLLSRIKQKISALQNQIEKEPDLGELSFTVLLLGNINKRRNNNI